MKKKHHLHLERSEMILLGLLRPYGRDETVARIVLSSSIDCFGLNRTQVIDSGLIIFLNEFRNRYHARSRFRSFPGDWFRRCGGLRGASAVRKPNSLLPCVPLNISWFAQGIGMLEDAE
ncbi:hypothetical protein CISIN_1g033472mg [Citrus sinensis]|uniref:Uncharacterized protein n=1 Tax=Citrus sinensis TaxID=2711 RepID=A0A067E669_CITSI|nr:hypothetical protein CISIN_1g033472mg [Citrus sinensis]